MSNQSLNPTEHPHAALSAPIAKKVPHITNIHGMRLVDNYAWMRDRKDPDLLPHLRAENAYHDTYMADTEVLQTTLYEEMRSRIKEDDSSVPYKRGKWLYYSRTETGQQYPKYCRRLDKPDSAEEVYLDLVELAKGLKFLQIGDAAFSPSGNFLAYTVDTTGFRQYKLVVKNLRTGQILADTAERVTSVEWAKDNKTIFYTTEDEQTKRSNLAFRHRIGTKRHALVSREDDEMFNIGFSKTRVGDFIYLSANSHTTSETSFIRADKTQSNFQIILPRKNEVLYKVDEDGKGAFYITTDDGAPNSKLVKAPVNNPGPENWQEIVAHRQNAVITGVDVFDNHLVIFERDNALPQVRVQNLSTGVVSHVTFQEPAYSVGPSNNCEFKTTTLRLSYSSFVTPPTTIDYDLDTHKQTVLKVVEVPNYDPSLYISERIFAPAADGTMIPISLLYKKDLASNGQRPLHLYAYGSYGYSIPVTFTSKLFSLVDRGVTYAIAHIRGGDDLGKSWHDQGKMKQKMNTFTDYIACAKHLIAAKYTSGKITAQGGSAGGLLMGAVANLRPDLFCGVVAQVPFVDVLSTMLDDTLPLTVGEYIEWGNPNVKDEFEYMQTYSPIDNITAQDYPPIYVETALNDSQVGYWEPVKYVAKLRELKTGDNPLVIHIELEEGGHGGASGRFDYLKEVAIVYAFVLKQIGILE